MIEFIPVSYRGLVIENEQIEDSLTYSAHTISSLQEVRTYILFTYICTTAYLVYITAVIPSVP